VDFTTIEVGTRSGLVICHLLFVEECLERMIFFGERALQVAVAGFLSHFHPERNYQGLGNRLIEPGEEVGRAAGDVECRRRLGGIRRYYYHQAA
jgi:hypothetical protein